MTSKRYNKLTAGIIAGWFAFSLTASALHLFETAPTRPPLPLLLAVLIPIVLFALCYGVSPEFREFVLSLDPRTLTMAQAWRIAGFVFLVLYTYRMLPGMFALPAGWGDVAIGATALLVAAKLATPVRRTIFILWQFLGVADLVTAISIGGLGRYIRPQDFTGPNGIATAPMTVLPLSLIPTFAVPLLFTFHVICVAQARRWPKTELEPVRGGVQGLAVHP